MTKTLIIFTATILLLACSTKQPDKDYYVIKHPATNTKDTGDIPPPPPPSTDTIKNRAYQIITDFFKSKKFIHPQYSRLEKDSTIRYNVRNWTEEEQYVITAKINKTKYDPNKVEWNEGFDIEFVPPLTK